MAVLLSALVSIAVTFGFGVIAYDPVSLVVIAGLLAWQTHQNAQTETIFAQHSLPHPEPLSQTG